MDEHGQIVVVELPEFQAAARKLFTNAEQSALIAYIASHPRGGDVIPHTGGVRKMRWKSKGKGKRGGACVIYFFHAANEKVYLFTVYAKNQKEDLSPAEKRIWREVIELLTSQEKDQTNGEEDKR